MTKKWLNSTHYAVLGMGRSGIAAANLLARRGKKVLASDTRSDADLTDVAAQLEAGIDLRGGGNHYGNAEVVVASPGLKPGLPIFAELRARQIPVISEIELAAAATDAAIIAITGTDGKSTTTVLVEHLIKSAGKECVAGGNLGVPLCELVESLSADAYLVAEVSAFQLWTTHHFKPAAVGLTNIAFDHLDYFDTYAEYVESKRRVLKNAGPETLGVFNLEDAYIQKWHADFGGKSVAYGLSEEAVRGAENAFWLDGEQVSARLGGVEHRGWLKDIKTLPISGPHNMLNLMCAAALAGRAGVTLAQAAAAAKTFKPLAHRLEFVAEIDGIHYFDDSKATNAHAALAGLRSLDGYLVPIVGGVDKGLDLGELVEFLKARASAVVLIGDIRERLSRELRDAGYPAQSIHDAADMPGAVAIATKNAGLSQDGATVSLSPACSSFDMFQSYAHRGDVFQQAVRALLTD